MTDLVAPAGDGHTELSEEDRDGLIPTYIATRSELFAAEERNIVSALRRRPPVIDELLDDIYLLELHRLMFGQVWSWAGTYRRRETNIGVPPSQISEAVRNLVADARAWAEGDVFAHDELAVRFHHRLVQVHPFANGNGRLGRVAADYLAVGLGNDRFSWGANLIIETAELRGMYVAALQRADRGDYSALLAFART